jgi:orotate phosphoribosyltransferase-like protein
VGHPWRTQRQNEILVFRVLDGMARGMTMGEVSDEQRVPYETVRKIMTRYRRQQGFRTTYQMIAARVAVRAMTGERKG